jgi:lipoate-protein ligase A
MRWRLIFSPFTDGPTNMATDEAILQAVAAGQAPPTLRFYGWNPPCLSLGYAQALAEVDQARLRKHGWDLVRRPTGGRAILHTDELTYSVIAPMDAPQVRGSIVDSYRALSRGLLRGLELLGLQAEVQSPMSKAQHPKPEARSPISGDVQSPTATLPPLPVCFEVPSKYEITANGKKLLGSAQVRKQGVVLQHGTLPLTGDIGRICAALAFASEAERAQVQARVYQRATTLESALGQPITWEPAAQAMQRGFAEALDLALEERPLTPPEHALAAQLRETKYAHPHWNARL